MNMGDAAFPRTVSVPLIETTAQSEAALDETRSNDGSSPADDDDPASTPISWGWWFVSSSTS
jgi:hypothetical protein